MHFHVIILWIWIDSAFSVVLELNEKFMDVRHQSLWLVKFYAPWCGHCKNLEPIWRDVGSSERLLSAGVRVGRLDATRFSDVAKEMGVQGYPTIQFVHGDTVLNYNGDRNKDDIIDFAIRAKGPAVRDISVSALSKDKKLTSVHKVFFLLVTSGAPNGGSELEDAYDTVAKQFQTYSYFYAASKLDATKLLDVTPVINTVSDFPAVIVFKDKNAYIFEAKRFDLGAEESYLKNLTNQLHNWVNVERFQAFPQIKNGDLYEIVQSKKLVVLVIIKMYPGRKPDKKHAPVIEVFRDIAENMRDRFHPHFLFGWMDGTDTINSIVSQFVQTPNMIVFKSDTFNYYAMDDFSSDTLTKESVIAFLDSVSRGEAPAYGGNSYLRRLYRSAWDFFAAIYMMFYNQPLITSLIFGLPSAMLTFICCNICCADYDDSPADNDDEDSDYHEKRE